MRRVVLYGPADMRSLQRDVAVGGSEMGTEESRLARLPRAGDQRRWKALYRLLQSPDRVRGTSMPLA